MNMTKTEGVKLITAHVREIAAILSEITADPKLHISVNVGTDYASFFNVSSIRNVDPENAVSFTTFSLKGGEEN